jgi:hypothetical protein
LLLLELLLLAHSDLFWSRLALLGIGILVVLIILEGQVLQTGNWILPCDGLWGWLATQDLHCWFVASCQRHIVAYGSKEQLIWWFLAVGQC